MNHPLEIIASWLSKNSLTLSEKRNMRNVLLEYATTHPVKSGLMSPYRFQYAMVALATFVFVLGGSAGITAASMKALPNQKLYPIKLWVEEFNASNQKTPGDLVAFETKRIETRFDEAARLALRQELDDTMASVIQSGLEHSRQSIKSIVQEASLTNPSLALQATSALENTFEKHGKILATIEKNTGQDVGTVVLAAEVTTKTLALERKQFEEIIERQPDAANKELALAKLDELKKRNLVLENPDLSTDAAPETTMMSLAAEPVAMKTVALVSMENELETPEKLIVQAQEKIELGFYSEALVLLQKAEQLLSAQVLESNLEETYNIQVEESSQENNLPNNDSQPSSEPRSVEILNQQQDISSVNITN